MLLTEVSNVSVFTSSMELLSQSLEKEREGEDMALFTQRSCTIAAAAVRQFSTVGCSHGAKHHRLKDEPLCNSGRKPMLWLLERLDGTHDDDDVCVFKVFPCPPVNLNLLKIYNHMDAVLMCSD